MSDEALVTTDVAAEAAPAVETPTLETPSTEGLNAYQIRRAMKSHVKDLVAQSAPASEPVQSDVVVDANGKPHDPATGKFLPSEPQAPVTPPAEAATPAATTPQTARIKLPDILATRYGQEVEVPSHLEELFRFAANNHVRAKEVEEARAQLAELNAKLARAEAAKAGWQKQTESALANPVVAARAAEIREAWGEEEAQRYLRGVQAELQSAVDTDLKQVDQQLSEQDHRNAAASFQRNAITAAQERYPQWFVGSPYFDEVLTRALRQYGTDLDVRQEMGEQVSYKVEELFEFADTLFKSHPKVRETAQQQITARKAAEARSIQEAAEAKAKSEAAAAEASRLAEAAKRHSTRAPAVPGLANTGAVVPQGDDLKKQSPSQQKKTLKSWVREIAAQR